MEYILFIPGAMTVALLLVHLADYFKAWPRRTYLVHRLDTPVEKRVAVGRLQGPNLPYDRAA